MRLVQEEDVCVVPELLVCGLRLFYPGRLHLLQVPPVGLSVYLSMASRYHAISTAPSTRRIRSRRHDCSPPCRPKRSRSTFHGPIPKALRDFKGAGVKDDTAADKAALTRKRERAPTRRFAEYLIADH